MRQTSLESYERLKKEGQLGNRQIEVLKAIKKLGTATDSEISNYLGKKDPNYVRPRRFELMCEEFIEEKERRQCTITKRKAIVWGLK